MAIQINTFRRREKFFGEGRCLPLDREAKVRIMARARALSHPTEKGKHYGWPFVSLGRNYTGAWQSGDRPGHEVFEPPVSYWMPAIAVSGLLFYTGDALPKWKGDVFVGSLRTGEIPGTGHLERIVMNEKMQEMRRERLLDDLHQRIRDVKQGPDGFIYLAVEHKNGSILRIVPAR